MVWPEGASEKMVMLKAKPKVIAKKLVVEMTTGKRLLVRIPKAKARPKTPEAKARPKTPGKVAMLKPTVTPGEVAMILKGVADIREAWRVARVRPPSSSGEVTIFLEKHVVLREALRTINWRARAGVWQQIINTWPTIGTDDAAGSQLS